MKQFKMKNKTIIWIKIIIIVLALSLIGGFCYAAGRWITENYDLISFTITHPAQVRYAKECYKEIIQSRIEAGENEYQERLSIIFEPEETIEESSE